MRPLLVWDPIICFHILGPRRRRGYTSETCERTGATADDTRVSMIGSATERAWQAGERLPPRMGANVVGGGAQFGVWAPDAASIDVEIGAMSIALERDDDGVWSGIVPGVGAGERYRFRIDGASSYPDPYSRSQPEGPHGPSEIVDPQEHAWSDGGWRGLRIEGLVIYECHVGVHTPDGTFDALAGDLDALSALGVNAIELLPVAEFPGERNWGYDGVNLFAPSRNYGGPAGLKRLVDAAHKRGIGVILDVVYNHFGPDGNYLLQFSKDYLTDRHHSPWGDAINFDGARSAWVRRYIIDNARHWLTEYHIDGLRLDAAFTIYDELPRHILQDLTAEARGCVDRDVVLIAETHENDIRYVLPVEAGGLGFDAVWADDFHHVAHAAASHEHSGYYVDYAGTTEELARTINRGWLFEGQHSEHFGRPRGTLSDGVLAPALVYCVQNHDQVGNRAFGRRFAHLAGGAADRAWSALLLLLPYTPLIFAGEEFVASSRFHYFTDHNEDLGRAITEGRQLEVAKLAEVAHHIDIPNPQDRQTFLDSKLDLSERTHGVGEQAYQMYRALLTLRRDDPVLRRQDRGQMHAIAASDQLLLVRMWDGREERLIVCNFGLAIDATPSASGVPDELLKLDWRVLLSTEARRFGGTDDRARFDRELIAMPPQTVALLGATRCTRRGRLWAAVRAAIERLPGQRR